MLIVIQSMIMSGVLIHVYADFGLKALGTSMIVYGVIYGIIRAIIETVLNK